ncbi:MAG: 3'-5' exonuclease [bacterium]
MITVIMRTVYAALDVETTGLHPTRGHRVIEIGVVLVRDGVIAGEFQSLIHCDRDMTKAAQRIHGISAAMLHGQPTPREVFEAFRNFIGNALLVAHNAPFDRGFLQREFSLFGWRMANRMSCTLELSRQLLPQLPNHRLETVARHLFGELPEGNMPHRALSDARLTARIWAALKER